MTCLIIDDNKIARNTLVQLASQISCLEISGVCETAIEAYNLLQTNPVDFLLLDVEMPGMTGIELTKNLGTNAPIIVLVTAKKDYALDAFELSIADYLLKPVTATRLIQTVEKVQNLLTARQEKSEIKNDEFLFIRDSNVVKRLKFDDILFAEAMGDYVKLHTAQRFYAIHSKLKDVEQRLPSNTFMRVHRSYIVAISKIDSIEDGALVLNGKSVPVADTYRALLNKRMNVL
ncbi:MAG: response regulator transcription factor [Bacteroidetes bacterium]|nr:response regulator transcription factor [Bacteroidota bacterium]